MKLRRETRQLSTMEAYQFPTLPPVITGPLWAWVLRVSLFDWEFLKTFISLSVSFGEVW